MKESSSIWTCYKKEEMKHRSHGQPTRTEQVTWAASQDRASRYFNKTVSPRRFQLGDWVLRKVSLITKDPTEGKLGRQYEGPYKVIRCHDKWAYHLIDTTARELLRAWNAEHLKKYFM
jgi:hypothetical protein